MKLSRQQLLRFILLCGLIVGIDALIKLMTVRYVPLMPWASPFYPYGGFSIFRDFLGVDFSINYVANRGSAWGLFAQWHEYLLAVRIVAIIALVVYMVYVNSEENRHIPLSLIIAGAVGNVIDSFFYGHVVDMFHFVAWGISCPVFNIADAAIFFGVMTLFVQGILEKRRETQKSSFMQGSDGTFRGF